MDLSSEGQEKMNQAHNLYLKKTTELDKKIVDKIHEIFAQPMSNNKKMQIFSNFSHFQKRPYIKQEL